MNKKTILWAVTLGLALVLCACGQQDAPDPPVAPPAATVSDDAALGTYHCVSVKMEDMDIGPEGQWLQLKDRGEAAIYLMDQPDHGNWTLTGATFTLAVGGETLGEGTLEQGVLTLDLLGTQCVFVKEGVDIPAEAVQPQEGPPEDDEDQPPAGHAYLSCYGDLYRITYPTRLFRPSANGLTDLVGEDGTLVWVARLTSRETVDQWLTGLETKKDDPDVLSCDMDTLPVGDYTGQVAVYEDAEGWHSAVVVNFGRDRGTKTYPMYAACLSFSGDSREAVWNDDIRAMAASFQLTV